MRIKSQEEDELHEREDSDSKLEEKEKTFKRKSSNKVKVNSSRDYGI